MQELFYSALDIAIIVSCMQLGCREESKVLDSIWKGEKEFLESQYRENQRKFLLDVYYWIQYLENKSDIDKELPAIEKDIEGCKRDLQVGELTSNFSDLDLFFKSIRIQILYGKGNAYVRMKLRTLLEQYGYRRRSKVLLQYVDQCMTFYRLEATLRGGVQCSVEKVPLNQMLVFRVK